MAVYARCITAFDWAGVQVKVGDLYDTTSLFYTRFSSKFDTPEVGIGPGTALTGGTLGSIIAGKIPVTDANGTSLGLMPIYNVITGT